MKFHKKNKFDVTFETLNSVIKKIMGFKQNLSSKTSFLGFDGYIDSLYFLVKSRKDALNFQKMKKMNEFAEFVSKVAGSSGNIERILKKKTSGGFAPNTAKALNTLGIKINLVAAMGYPNIYDVFTSLSSKESINAISFSNPGETLGLEFHDGKVLLPDFSNIIKLNWELIKDRVGLNTLIFLMNHSNILGFGHWSSIPRFNEIWENIVNEVLPNINNSQEKILFTDLADIKKRSTYDIKKMIKLLKKINEYIPVLLSLNDQEAVDITKNLDHVATIDPSKKNFKDYFDVGKRMNQELNLSYLVIHSPHFATISLSNEEHYWVTEGFTSKPKYTTGAGEYFHSGTIAALSCEMSPNESILIGNALTAIFVRTGSPPTFDKLKEYIFDYMSYIEEDKPEFPN